MTEVLSPPLYINDHLPAQETENEVNEDNLDLENDDNDCDENNDDGRNDNNDDGRDYNNDDDRDNHDDLRDVDEDDEEDHRQSDNDDNNDKDFDTEWHDFQNTVTQLGEKFKGYWNDENFRKAFRKFKTKCSRMKNANQNTLIKDIFMILPTMEGEKTHI